MFATDLGANCGQDVDLPQIHAHGGDGIPTLALPIQPALAAI